MTDFLPMRPNTIMTYLGGSSNVLACRLFDFSSICIILPLFVAAIVCQVIHNLFFHSAKGFPGPVLARATRLYYTYFRCTGTLEYKVRDLHALYGPVVRIAPDELSFSGGTAWEDIYGSKSRQRRLQKDPHFYMGAIAPNGQKTLGAANDADHARIRGVLSHAFTEKAVKGQEQIIQAHTSYLVRRVRELKGASTDATMWMHHIAHDTVVHLCFGEDAASNALSSDDWEQSAKLTAEAIIQGVPLVELLRYVPFKERVLRTLIFCFGQAQQLNFAAATKQAQARIESSRELGADFISYILRAKNTIKELNEPELAANIALLIDAGSETTASMLSGALFFLATCTKSQQRLASELRDRFKSEGEICVKALQTMPYLSAVIEECLRLYPSVPSTLPRVTPACGAIVSGHYVPAGLVVGVNQFATYRSSINFEQADSFMPERWIDRESFKTHRHHALQPFSIGSRGCIGKQVAYAEIRLVLAKMIWNFILELEPESLAWDVGQETYFIWKKPSLRMRFKQRE